MDLVGEIYDLFIVYFFGGELIRPDITLGQANGDAVFHVHLRLHGADRFITPTGLQFDHTVVMHDDLFHIVDLDLIFTGQPADRIDG